MTEVKKCKKGLHWMNDSNTIVSRQWSNGSVTLLCRSCRLANQRRTDRAAKDKRAAKQRRLVAQATKRGLAPGDPRHGTGTGYVYWGCRCQECRDGAAAADRLLRLKRKALAAGLSQREIDAILGTPGKSSITAGISFEDRLVGSVYDNPVLDEVLERLS